MTTKLQHESDETLVRVARTGDNAAFSELMLRTMPMIRRKAGQYHLPGMEAEDIVQEGLVGLLKATAFVCVVGMPELLKRAMEIVEWKANPTPLVTITIMYLILLLPLMYGSTLLERRLARWTTPHRA